jgi:tetratricopeptide (TPR) repeat protein
MRDLKVIAYVLIITFIVPIMAYALTADDYRRGGVKYVIGGNIEEAISAFRSALEVDGTYRRARQVKNSIEILQKVLKGQIKKEAAIHLFKAVNYADYQEGMVDEAIAHCKKAIELDPNYADPHSFLGLVYSSSGLADGGIVEFRKAIELDPGWVDTYCVLGIAYMGKGMFDEAIAQFKRAVNINHNWAEAHNGLGAAYSEKGMIDEGIAEFRKALKINPHLVDAQGNLGESFLKKGMLNESIAELHKALKIDPNYAPAHANLARAYFQNGNYKLAMKHYDKAAGLGESLPSELLQSIKSNLAYVYDPTGKPDPFKPFVSPATIREELARVGRLTPLQRLEISQLTLVGIIWNERIAKAVIQDASGKGYIVARGTLVGKKGGYIKRVLKNKIVIEEKSKDFMGRVKVREVEIVLHRPEERRGS